VRPTPIGCAVLALAALGACAGPRGGSADGQRGAAQVQVADLPARYREVLSDYGAGGATWDARRPEVRADPELARFVIENLAIEMVRAHDALVGADPVRARAALDRAQAELVRLAPESVPTLVELFALGDDVVSSQVGLVLAEIPAPGNGVSERASRLLEDPRVRARRRAARLLGELAPAGADEQRVQSRLVAALGDADWMVRAESARALGRRAGRGRETRGARAVLEGALTDPDPAVAACAAEGLGALEDPLAVPALTGALERAVETGDLKLLSAAQKALRGVSGERSELDLAGWRRWWSEHGGQIRARSAGPAR